MSDTQIQAPGEEQTPGADDAPTTTKLGAALDGIRKQRSAMIGKDYLDLLVPGYEGNLKIRYRNLSDEEHDQLTKAVERANEKEDTAGERRATANVLVKHHDMIFVRESGDEEFILLEEGDGPIRFGREIVRVLGLSDTVDTATMAVIETFSPIDEKGRRTQPDAMATHMQAIVAWRQGRMEDINKAVLGE